MKYEILKGYNLDKTSSKKKIFFYHVPKCAGLSFTRALRPSLQSVRIAGWCHTFPSEIIVRKSFSDDINRKLNSIKLNINSETYQASESYSSNKNFYENFQFLSGHLPFNSYLNTNNRLTITILRDPIARAISNYQFWIQKGFIKESEDLEYLLDKKILKSNLITEFFSNERDPNLEVASNNLKKIDIVTDVSNINRLLNYLISCYNLPNIILTRENVSDKQFKLNNNQIEIIKHYNSMDSKLYNKINKITFNFDKYENKTIRNNSFYSFYSTKKIFNNRESIIFDNSNLKNVLNHLEKLS